MALNYFPQSFSLSSLALAAALLSLIYLLHRRATKDRIVPAGLSWVGLRNERFATTRLHLRDAFAAPAHLKEGYEKYSKANLPFISPNITFRPVVILPPSHFRWLISQPDDVLSIAAVLKDAVQFHYTSPSSWTFSRAFHVEALNKMPLDLLTSAIVDEITTSIDTLWGTDSSTWRKVPVSTMNTAICRITNRVFVGADLSRDPTYIAHQTAFVHAIALSAGLINNALPKLLHPLLGPLVALPCRYYDYRCSRYIVPLVEHHLRLCVAAAVAQSADIVPSFGPPRDMLQFFARYAVRSADAADRNARAICSRLLALNFVGIHTSTMTMVNALLDMLSPAGAARECWAAVREEAVGVLRAHGGVWSKAAVNQLVRNDSVFRESLRFSPFKLKGVDREVVASKGVVLPDGTYLPKGTRVALPTHGVHFDDRFYSDPMTFDPWRFVGVEGAGMIAAGETFLGFGLGRHACPGRFFSAHELKLLLAYITLNYDIQPLEERYANTEFSDFSVPRDIELTIKRRKQSAHLDDD
ncbi:cytochrome P450 [Mytilinidion resinicola]|uniref:Cytochrome P450 n=1 Tax=Mytilinidion resinicola TaxID=574789 RepID=A0A6A6YV27_9PEZI|nr:cytochrome P450 [Mytilinidion resinicola]KAF2811844.1 cytochrome P450 [Mytilinidion resinicola]